MNKISCKACTYIIVCCCFVLINSCKTKKDALAKSISDTKSSKELVGDVMKSSLEYTTISSKGNIEMAMGNTKKKFPAAFKIEKDKAMQVSLRDPFIGAIEGARITFTTDSIIILDRVKQRFVAEKYSNSALTKDIAFNFSNLQALLTNHIFVPGAKNMDQRDYAKFKLSLNETNYLATIVDKNNLQYTFAIDGTYNLTSTLIAQAQKNIALKWDYSDFVVEGKSDYPTKMSAEVSMPKMKIHFIISYSKLEIDKNMQIDSSIPSKYKQISFREFIDSYIKL